MVTYPLVKVVWLDHCGYTQSVWRSTSFVKEDLAPFEVETIGFMLKETDDFIILASTISPDPEDEKSQMEMCILKSCIKSRKDYE